MDAKLAPELSSNNRDDVCPGVPCGCYFCLRRFDGGTVVEWVDDEKTALCPFCGVDAVLPAVTDADDLVGANEMWFTGISGD